MSSKMSKKRLAIFASGRGSNARTIVEHFQDHTEVEVALILSNREDALVLEMAAEHGIPTHVTNRAEFRAEESVVPHLQVLQIDWIALAGFLWLIPSALIQAYPKRIVNIHPALLPKYGGKGMYGMNVHRAVKESAENESGITIHLIDEEYDKGEMAFQARVQLDESCSPEKIAAKVLKLEHRFFPVVIEALMTGLEMPDPEL